MKDSNDTYTLYPLPLLFGDTLFEKLNKFSAFKKTLRLGNAEGSLTARYCTLFLSVVVK